MDETIDIQAEMLAQKVKHYLITRMGVTVDEASYRKFYHALALTLREEIMINWTATGHTWRQNHVRMMYYLCMEYMPGKFFMENVINMNALGLIQRILAKLRRNFEHVIREELEPGLGNGGMGRLLSCFLDSLATQSYPARAYGLRYQYGIFEQEVWDGVQVERPDHWLLVENPWEFRRDDHMRSVYYAGRLIPEVNKRGVEANGLADYEEVRALAFDLPIIGYADNSHFSVATLRLWSTKESPRNFELQRYNAGQLGQAAENTILSDVLYPNDNNETGKRIRLKQEFLLVSASVQDIMRQYERNFSDFSMFGDKVRIHINDTHPALVIAELMRVLLREQDFSWAEAWEVVQNCCSFTNHTILQEALEEWNAARLQYLLPRQYRIIEQINLAFCNTVRRRFPGDEARVKRMSVIEGGQVRMAHLAILGSHRVNGVAELHTEIIKSQLFPDFYQMFPEKFLNITNGVTPRRWILTAHPELATFISERIGKQWITDFTTIRKLADFAADPLAQQQFLAIKGRRKSVLANFLRNENPVRNGEGKIVGHSFCLDEDALFEIQIKRIHEYKRQLMQALHTLMVYQELKEHRDARRIKRMVIFAGKAAPGYAMAKNVIQLIYCIARKINNDSETNGRLAVAFVENYNVSKAEMMIPAADLSVQISAAGTEASGTGNMKLTMNGALTVGTEDGANVEMRQNITDTWWPFRFGATAEQNHQMMQAGSYHPLNIYAQDGAIRKAIDTLRDGSLTEKDLEHQTLDAIAHTLLSPSDAGVADRYFVLNDLRSYFEVQKRVEELYLQPHRWAEFALHNIAGMGNFSADTAVHNYARDVWGLQPCPPDGKELQRVRDEYSEHDKCRILGLAKL